MKEVEKFDVVCKKTDKILKTCVHVDSDGNGHPYANVVEIKKGEIFKCEKEESYHYHYKDCYSYTVHRESDEHDRDMYLIFYNDFYKYFTTLKEIRKLKLNRINETRV